MSLVEYDLALRYALETYIRRDIVFVMGKIYGKKKPEGEGTTIIVPQPEIEAWIKKQYEDDIESE